MANSKICSIPECGKPVRARGWCPRHYKRWFKHGDPLGGGRDRPLKGSVPIYLHDVVMQYDGDECLIWPFSRNNEGYPTIGGGEVQSGSRLVTRIICEAVHGKSPLPKRDAAHSCGNGHLGCVTKRHLSWKTRSENNMDKVDHGTHNRGERHPHSKLTKMDVVKIISLCKAGMMQKDIAPMFGVNPGTISVICSGKSWSWLPR